jgi:hypothetical protein
MYEFGIKSGQIMISSESHYELVVSLNFKSFLYHMTSY